MGETEVIAYPGDWVEAGEQGGGHALLVHRTDGSKETYPTDAHHVRCLGTGELKGRVAVTVLPGDEITACPPLHPDSYPLRLVVERADGSVEIYPGREHCAVVLACEGAASC